MRSLPSALLRRTSRRGCGGISRISVGRRKVPNQAALAESEAELCCAGGWWYLPFPSGKTLGMRRVGDGDGRALSVFFSLEAINSDLILEAVASTA